MDPFAALGFVSNIVQFIDFSCKLFSNTKEIYRSASGASLQVLDAVAISKTLHDLSARLLRQSVYSSGGPPESPSTTDVILNELAANCRNAATELLSALDNVQARGSHSKWQSFRAALQSVMKDEKIEGLKQRLEGFRRQIIMTLEIMQSEQQSTILRRINTLYEANCRLHADMTHQIANFRQSIVEAITIVREELSRQDWQITVRRQQVGKDDFFKSMKAKKPIDIDPPIAALSSSARVGSEISIALRLLKTFRFNSMTFRYSKISTAHLNTFHWMFDHTFSLWLSSNHPIFWISGKPGSGKSTLMKFLVGNEDVPRHLAKWSGDSKLVIASYFFWINGTEIQKSQEGLLRSLLYDLLRQEPDLMHSTFPEQWNMLESGWSEDDLPPWNRQQLLDGFARLINSKISSSRFCIFIDGLDEYEGEHEDLIHVVRGLAKTNVKMCIASRPWNIFEAAFGDDEMHKIYLEYFNKADIELYVKDKLEIRPDFQAIQLQDFQANQLVQEVISKAQGVFLWVYLVVRSLIQGLQNSDRIEDLQRRLRAFPSDLDQFFTHILLSLDETYRVQAARIFQVALAAPRTLSLLNYWYVDMDELDGNFFAKIPVNTLNPMEIKLRQDHMWKRLNGRCKGLLEFTQIANSEAPYNHRVDFLHRTVKDFLRTKDIQQLLIKWSTTVLTKTDSDFESGLQESQVHFDPYQTLCKSSLAELKTGPIKYGYLRNAGPIHDLVSNICFSAQQYELRNKKSLGNLITDLNMAISKHSADYPTQRPHYPWADWGSEDVMMHAIKWNLVVYVQEKLDSKPLSISEKTRLLVSALEGRFGRSGDTALGPAQEMIEEILKRGPAVTLDARIVKAIIGSLRNFDCTTDELYGSLMLLITHRTLKVKPHSEVWQDILSLLSHDEIMSLHRNRYAARRRSRNPFRRWFS